MKNAIKIMSKSIKSSPSAKFIQKNRFSRKMDYRTVSIPISHLSASILHENKRIL